MDSGGETNAILIAIVNCVIELHEDITKDVHFFEADLINTKRLDDIATFASIRVLSINLTSYPVVARHVIFDSVYHIGQVGEGQLIAFAA